MASASTATDMYYLSSPQCMSKVCDSAYDSNSTNQSQSPDFASSISSDAMSPGSLEDLMYGQAGLVSMQGIRGDNGDVSPVFTFDGNVTVAGTVTVAAAGNLAGALGCPSGAMFMATDAQQQAALMNGVSGKAARAISFKQSPEPHSNLTATDIINSCSYGGDPSSLAFSVKPKQEAVASCSNNISIKAAYSPLSPASTTVTVPAPISPNLAIAARRTRCDLPPVQLKALIEGDPNEKVVLPSMTVDPKTTITPYSDASRSKKPAKAGRIKRPMNAFMVFGQIRRRAIIAEYPELHNAEISKQLGRVWKEMSEEARRPYKEEAERLAALHALEFPDYKYRPRKNKSKSQPAKAVTTESGRVSKPKERETASSKPVKKATTPRNNTKSGNSRKRSSNAALAEANSPHPPVIAALNTSLMNLLDSGAGPLHHGQFVTGGGVKLTLSATKGRAGKGRRSYKVVNNDAVQKISHLPVAMEVTPTASSMGVSTMPYEAPHSSTQTWTVPSGVPLTSSCDSYSAPDRGYSVSTPVTSSVMVASGTASEQSLSRSTASPTLSGQQRMEISSTRSTSLPTCLHGASDLLPAFNVSTATPSYQQGMGISTAMSTSSPGTVSHFPPETSESEALYCPVSTSLSSSFLEDADVTIDLDAYIRSQPEMLAANSLPFIRDEDIQNIPATCPEAMFSEEPAADQLESPEYTRDINNFFPDRVLSSV